MFHLPKGRLDFHKGGPIDFDNIIRKKQDEAKRKSSRQEDQCQTSDNNADTSAHR